LKQRRHDQFGGWEEDREADTAQENELMSDRIGITVFQLENLCINISEEKAGQKLPKLAHRIILLH
jgi:hypothetical protein